MTVNASLPNLRSSWSFQRKSPAETPKTSLTNGSDGRTSWQNSLSSAGTVQGAKWKKFGTVSTAGSQSKSTKRASASGLQGLFRDGQENVKPDLKTTEKHLHLLEDQAWEISVAEKRNSGKRNKVHIANQCACKC